MVEENEIQEFRLENIEEITTSNQLHQNITSPGLLKLLLITFRK